jgi:hypothetical protein
MHLLLVLLVETLNISREPLSVTTYLDLGGFGLLTIASSLIFVLTDRLRDARRPGFGFLDLHLRIFLLQILEEVVHWAQIVVVSLCVVVLAHCSVIDLMPCGGRWR